MRIYATDTELSNDMTAKQDANKDWDDIGEVHDFILRRDGTVKAVVLGVGGFLGMHWIGCLRLTNLRGDRVVLHPNMLKTRPVVAGEILDVLPETLGSETLCEDRAEGFATKEPLIHYQEFGRGYLRPDFPPAFGRVWDFVVGDQSRGNEFRT